MSRLSQIIAGWGIGLGAIGLAFSVFPVIADQAAAQRDAEYWTDRASVFQDTREDDQDISSLARTLTDIYTDKALKNPAMRERRFLDDLEVITRKDILQAKYETRQYRCLSEAVYYEARSEPVSGQMAVAEVVLNRIKSKHYPNTICGVVYEGAERTTGCQFSFTCDGSTMKEPYGSSWKNSQNITRLILSGGIPPVTSGATHYHTVAVQPHWSETLKLIKTIGTHKFYKFKWRERPVPSLLVKTAPPS